MKNINTKSRWTRLLAGVSAAVMLVASLGAMPIVSAEGIEIEGITLIPEITFDDLNDYTNTENASSVEIEEWNKNNAFVFKKGKTDSGDTYTAELKTRDEGGKYLAGVYNTDKTDGTEKTAYIYVYGSNGGAIADSFVAAGNQIVYEFSTHSGKTLNMYTQTQGKKKAIQPSGSYAYWYASSNYLFDIDDGKLYLGTGMNDTSDKVKKDGLGYINLPENQWVDIRIVYTIYDDGKNKLDNDDKFKTSVAAYVNNEICFPKKLDNKGYTTDNGETWLPLNVGIKGTYNGTETTRYDNVTPFYKNDNTKIERVTIKGSADMALDNFAITKYSGKKYDVKGVEPDKEAAMAKDWYGNKIFVGDGELASAVVAKIEGIETIDDCTLYDADDTEVEGEALARTASYASITDTKGGSSRVQILTKSDLASEFTPTTLSGDEGEEMKVVDKSGDYKDATSEPGTLFAKFGKEAGNKAYTWYPEGDSKNWIWKRTWIDNSVNMPSSGFENKVSEAVPIYISYDILWDGSQIEESQIKRTDLGLSGAVVTQNPTTEETKRTAGSSLMSVEIENGKLVYYVNNGTGATATSPVAETNIKQWHNVTLQFLPYTDKFEFYLDGELVEEGAFFENFIGINNLCYDVRQKGFWIDNFVIQGGFYNAVPNTTVVTLPETEDLPEGYSWAEDGVTLNINKAALKEEVAEAYTTEDGEVVYLDAEGNETDDMAMVNQIAVRATDGDLIRYWPIKARTGMGRFNLGDNRWMIDVADGKGNMNEDVKVYVAKYNEKNVLVDIDKYDVDKVDGDTWFVNATEGIEKSDKVFIWSQDGKISPVYKDALSVVCWGDSLTEGVGGNGVAYPDELAKLTGYNVINMGVGGESLITIGARSGAYNIVLGEDLSIPANRTSVDIKLSSSEIYDENAYAGKITPCKTSRGGWTPAEIIIDEDTVIEGRLYTDYDEDEEGVHVLTSATFRRSEAGGAVVAPAGSKIKVAAHDVKGDINIYWAGTNKGWDANDKGNTATDIGKNMVIGLKKMILENEGIDLSTFADNEEIYSAELEDFIPDAQYIVIGMTSDSKVENNPDLAAAFGANFLDVKEYLASKQALVDAGVIDLNEEPDQRDAERLGEGKIPTSLLDDGTHFNALGYKLIAKQVYLKMMSLGY